MPSKPISPYECEASYLDLRSRALEIAGTDIVERREPDGILMMLMETGYPEDIATLVMVSDGATSLYFSNGGGMIGAGEHEDVAALTQKTLRMAANHMDQMVTCTDHPLPSPGEVRFYVVTRTGIKTLAAPEDALGEGRHQTAPLFHQCHEVLAAIRHIEAGEPSNTYEAPSSQGQSSSSD